MARTAKKSEIVKEASKQKNVEETTVNTPVEIVNEKNEIVYDANAELKKIEDSIGEIKETVELPSIATDALNELKKIETISENVTKEELEDKVATLETLKKKIDESTSELEKKIKNDNFNFTDFWGGFNSNF